MTMLPAGFGAARAHPTPSLSPPGRGPRKGRVGLRPGHPTLLDVVVTRSPAKMLPGADARTLEIKPGDRPA
jgi:acetolactate synthase-1/2/3 large subunit